MPELWEHFAKDTRIVFFGFHSTQSRPHMIPDGIVRNGDRCRRQAWIGHFPNGRWRKLSKRLHVG